MKYIRQQSINVVDESTGETKEVTLSMGERIIKNNEPAYVKLYIDDLKHVYGIDGGDLNLLVTLAKYMNYENIVDLVPRIKDEIMNQLGWTNKASLSTSLYRLKKSSVIFSVGRGSYRINPYLFAKGGWTNVSKIRTTIEYSLTGRVVTHDFETTSNND